MADQKIIFENNLEELKKSLKLVGRSDLKWYFEIKDNDTIVPFNRTSKVALLNWFGNPKRYNDIYRLISVKMILDREYEKKIFSEIMEELDKKLEEKKDKEEKEDY